VRAIAVGLSVNTQKCEVNCHRSNACRCQWFCRLALWDVLNFASRARSFVMSSPESCRIKRFLKFISHFFSGRWDRASIRTRWSMFDLSITAKGGTLPSCYRSQGFRRCIAVVADLRISGQERAHRPLDVSKESGAGRPVYGGGHRRAFFRSGGSVLGQAQSVLPQVRSRLGRSRDILCSADQQPA
jgi:hypothetical protein